MTLNEIYLKIASFCAYQDRSVREVKERLGEWEVPEEKIHVLVTMLVEDKFLDEQRYVKSFVRGKFKLKKWGRRKIRLILKQKGISDELIKEGFTEIDPEFYWNTIIELVRKKQKTLKETDPWKQQQKIAYFLSSKGYELDLVMDAINELSSKTD